MLEKDVAFYRLGCYGYALEADDVIRSYIFFEPLICERRLTLDLHHREAFANLSKPLRPLVRSISILIILLVDWQGVW